MTTTTHWEPFRDLFSSQDFFNPLFGQATSASEGQGTARGWVPPVDVYETPENLVIKAELPGVDPSEVELWVEGNTLYLKGERKPDHTVKEGGGYHRAERIYGGFSRSLTLPNSLDSSKISAEYKDGILILTAPKRQEAQPRTIKVRA